VSLNDLYLTVKPSIVRIVTPESAVGTGWAIEEDLIVTAFHVIEGFTFDRLSVFIPTDDGTEEVIGRVIGWDKMPDIALLRIEATLSPLPLGNLGSADVPEPILGIGWSNGVEGFPSAKFGVVTTVKHYPDLDVRAFQSDAAFDPGDSGGPVIDMDGNVVGIMQFIRTMNSSGVRILGQQTALHVSSLKEILDDLKAGKLKNSTSEYWFELVYGGG
tara:strand:+ start:1359 stop:2006 length:648 start_codon:yes stop_codon:yes gene_type:complete